MIIAIPAGTTSKIIHVVILDTDGDEKTNLAYTDITAKYIREDGTLTALTMEATTVGTWASSGDDYLGFVKVNDTDAPGLYELNLPNNMLAAGADHVVLTLTATGCQRVWRGIQLQAVPSNVKDIGEVAAVYAMTYSGNSSGTLYKVGVESERDYFENADGTVSLRWYPALGSGQWKLMVGLAEWDKLGSSPLGDYTQGGAPTITVTGPRLVVGYDWNADVLNAPLFTLASVWTNTKAGYIDAAITSRHASGAAVAKSPATLATADVTGNLPANVVDWKGATAPAMTGDAFARLGAPTGESVSADIAGIHAKTTNLPASPAAVGSAMTLASGAITYDKFASSAITAGAFATDAISAGALSAAAVAKIVAGQADVYTAKVTRGRNGNTEIYLVNWFKNGVAIVADITDATITVMPVTTPASPLISAATLNADGLAYGYLYYSADPSTEKSAAGVMYGATLSAVIDGDTRTFPWAVVKDA